MAGGLGKISIHKSLSHPTRESQFEQIYRLYFDQLYVYARVICNSSELAKDVVSDFFFNLWKGQADLTAISNLESYLYVSVKNQALQMLNKKASEQDRKGVEVRQRTVEMINPEEILLEKELREVLDKIVERLPAQCGLVFRMAREKGMKYSEIAEELGISVETVKSQLTKAQSRLRTGVLKHYQNENGQEMLDVRLIGQLLLFIGYGICEISK